MLTLSGSLDSLRPPTCTKLPCTPASTSQTAFLYCALALIALGTGGIKPCVSSFGADQFDEADKKEAEKKYAFFNWFFFAINMGAVLGITLLVYVQTEVGWEWGFGIPTASTVCSIFILVFGFKKYRYQKPMGSVFTRFVQVIVASIRNHVRGVEASQETGRILYEVDTKESDTCGARKLSHTQQYRLVCLFLNWFHFCFLIKINSIPSQTGSWIKQPLIQMQSRSPRTGGNSVPSHRSKNSNHSYESYQSGLQP